MVSTAEPFGELQSPLAETTVSGLVTLDGTASDNNGIGGIYVSLDNGNTFNLADGTEAWTYPLNTTLLADGTHSIQIRAVDAVGVEAFYTAQISVDNTAPDLHIASPADGDRVAGTLTLDGRVSDGSRLESVRYDVRPLGRDDIGTRRFGESDESVDSGPGPTEGVAVPVDAEIPVAVLSAELSGPGVFLENIDLGTMSAGWYNRRLDAVDAAGNNTYVSRNFVVQPRSEEGRIEILFPGRGESVSGAIEIGGRVVGMEAVGDAVILVDGAPVGSSSVSRTGYYSLAFEPGEFPDGEHTVAVSVTLDDGSTRDSEEQQIVYDGKGPWVSFSNLGAGTYVTGRPILEGTAGYSADEEAKGKEQKKELAVLLVEVSFDNGRSFVPAKGADEWRYRLETSLIPDGDLLIMVRAGFANGDQAVRKTLVIVDRTAPEVRLTDPSEGRRFNDTLSLSGTTFDNSGLADLAVSLREGSKGRYQVPGFIQGLYLDAHALGATYADMGLGVSFFDDNVRLQLQMGMAPPGRFSGLVVGTKLLANIVYLPFSYWFGPGWDFFSMSFALGANFSYFTMSEDAVAFTSDGLVLAAVLGQWEMARFSVEEWKTFSYVSLYTEGNLWFISSDVQAGFESRVCLGARVGFF